MKRKSLGRGLDALIPSSETKTESQVINIDIHNIFPGNHQPRKDFNDQKLNDLVSSVKNKGIIQPILLKHNDSDGTYTIIAGERRWRAATAAGLKSVPAIIKDIADKDLMELALIENIQRQDLNPIEEAEAYKHLMDEHSLTQDSLAERVGKERSTVANYLRLLKLNEKIKCYLLDGRISMGHARVLCGINEEPLQISLADMTVEDVLSVRQLEQIAAGGLTKQKKAKPRSPSSTQSPEILDVEDRLRKSLATKVKLLHNNKSNHGRITIEYYSLDELDRLIDILTK